MNTLLRALQGDEIDLDQQEFAARKSANPPCTNVQS